MSTNVSPAEAHALMREQGYAYLDVRTVEEFALGHPEGAYNVPLRLTSAQGRVENPDFLAVVRATFALDHALVIGCQSGSRSKAALALLAQAGFTRLADQRAGFAGVRDPFGQQLEPGWQALGLPCGSEALPGRDYAALLARKS